MELWVKCRIARYNEKRSELCDKKLQLDFFFFIPLQGEKKLKLQDVNS